MLKIKKLLNLPLIAGMALSVIMPLLSIGTAHAVSNGLGITPRKDYTIAAGQKQSDTLYLDNLSTNQSLHVSLKVVDFSSSGQNGTPALDLAPNAPQTPWSLKPFLNIKKTATVPAGKSTYIPFTISIPKGQGAGSYYSAVEYAVTGVGSQQNVNVAASGATLIFVTVPGKASELMHLTKFGAFQPTPDDSTGSFTSWFFTSTPKVLAYVLQNKGNVAEQPSGTIIIKNISGKKIKTIAQANPKDSLALIDQTRRFEACIDPVQQTVSSAGGQSASETVCGNPKLSPGRYTATLYVYYGSNGNPTQQIVATATFWYLPWWFLLLILLAITVLTLVIYLAIHKAHHRVRRTLRK